MCFYWYDDDNHAFMAGQLQSFKGHYPAGLKCFPASRHLIHCAELDNKLFDLFN